MITISAMSLATLLTLSGCCDKQSSFEFGCVDDCKPQIVIQRVPIDMNISSELLECDAIPKPPEGITRDSEVMSYTVEVYFAGQKCRQRLIQIKELIEDH